MVKIKMDDRLKEILKTSGVPDSTIDLVEDNFNSQAEALVDAVKEDTQQQQDQEQQEQAAKPISKMEMARNARIIK